MKKAWMLLFFVLLVGVGCENNPLGRGKIDDSARRLSGKVRLDRAQTSAGVLVWLDGFEVSARTDQNGGFELILPPVSETDGISGSFKLFFYMANFKAVSMEVAIREGRLILPQVGISRRGELAEPVLLFQKLRVETKVRPLEISRSQISVTAGLTNLIARVDVALQAIHDSVAVYFPPLLDDVFGPLMFRNLKTNEVTVLRSTLATAVDGDSAKVGQAQTVRTMLVPIFPDDFDIGEYEVIPFLLIEDDALSPTLRDHLRLTVVKPGPEYLKVPFLRSGKQKVLHVIE